MVCYNITHPQGDTYIQNYSFIDNALVAINLTWAWIIMSIKENTTDTAVLLTSNFTIISAVLWTAKVSFTATQMNLAVWNYFYDIQFTDSLWAITTLLKGSFTITYDIT